MNIRGINKRIIRKKKYKNHCGYCQKQNYSLSIDFGKYNVQTANIKDVIEYRILTCHYYLHPFLSTTAGFNYFCKFFLLFFIDAADLYYFLRYLLKTPLQLFESSHPFDS